MARISDPKDHTKSTSAPHADGEMKSVYPEDEKASPLSIDGIRGGTINHVAVKLVMFLLIGIFAVGFLFTSFNPGQGPGGGAAPTNVALVGNEPIERGQFEQVAARQDEFMSQFGQKVGPAEYFGSRQQVLQTLVNNAALVQAAREAGITVSNDEIQAEIKKQIDDQIKSQQAQGEAAFRRAVEAQHGSVENYRAEMQKILQGERANLEKFLMVQKYEQKIKDENKVTEDDYKKSQTTLKIRQIVINPKLAPAGDKALTDKNNAEAKTRADKIAAQLKQTPTVQNFATVAQKESDDAASKAKGGDLGWKKPAELPVQPATRQAIVNSNDKIIGPIVDETSGAISIFFVENRVLKLPGAYGNNKAALLKEFETAQDNEAWSAVQAEIARHAHPEISDPGMQAYKIQTEQVPTASAEQQNKLRQDALAKYEEALGYAVGIEAAAVRYQMAQLYRDLKQPQKAAEVLKVAVEETSNEPLLQVEYARSLRDAGDKTTALTELQKVSKELDDAPPAAPSMFGGNPNDALRFQIASEFEALERKELAEAERKKIAPQGAGGMPGGMMMPGGAMPGGIDPHAGHDHD